jgi:hypothetical protein
MTKDNKINIKIEVCRDNNSGKLQIMAHFDGKAPNVTIDKNDYSWWPTVEERDLINEAFGLLPSTSNTTSFPTPTETRKEEAITEPVIEEEKPSSEPIIEEEIKPSPEPETIIKEEESEELPPIEKTEEESIFGVADKETKPMDYEEKIEEIEEEIKKEKEDLDAKVDIKSTDEIDTESAKIEKEEDEGIIVEADSEAIEAALEKHSDKDDSIVEADEQTIIDKVLSQKKKGKWRR